MQPLSREQLNRNRYLRTTSFEGKSDTGDKFRRAKGDSYPRNRPTNTTATMAPNDDAGEDTYRGTPFSSPITVIAATTPSPLPMSALDASETLLDDISNCSSPPTHPAFFPSAKREAGRGGGVGKENIPCQATPTSVAKVSFSPLSSPLAALMARKSASPKQRQKIAVGGGRGGGAAAAGPVMLGRFLDGVHKDDGGGNDPGVGDGWDRMEVVLGNVDTNILAPRPNENNDTNGGHFEANDVPPTGKKNKRKVKQTNGANGANGADTTGDATEHMPPPPTSYADAVKEDPAIAEKRESEGTEQHEKSEVRTETVQNEGSDSGKGIQEKVSPPTAAGDMTFAEAAKADPADAEKQGGKGRGKERPRESSPEGKKSDQSTPVISQASTSVEYPDIQSDAGDEEDEQRRRDRQRAPQVLGTRWAPVKVPFKRRLQTAAVLMHCLGIGLTLSIFFSFCAVPFFWPIIIIYLFSILFATDAVDGKLKKRKEWVRRLPIWTYFAEYFPARLHKTHDLQPTRKYILGYHPHGIISHGAWAAFATDALGFSEKFPGITNSLLTLDSNFQLPLYREYVFSMGVLSVSKESITNILTRGGPNNEGMGRAVTIVVGGARESLEAQPKTMRLIIKERKGFIKLALRTGADLVPVIAFGENDLYDQLDPHRHPWLHGMQRYFLKAWKFTVPLLHGRGIFNYDVGLMPYRRPLNIVVGKPIPVVQADNPDNSEVNRLHDLYTEELQKIWDTYKDEFAAGRKEEMQFLT